jgi:hypothetical protein
MTPRLTGLAMVAALALSGCATQGRLPDRFAVGRDGSGARCTVNRSWAGGEGVGTFDLAYGLTCEGAEASRTIGTITAIPARKRTAEADASCGAATQAMLAGIGAVEARRCFSETLAGPAIVIRFTRDGTSYRGVAATAAVVPMERAMVALATGSVPSADAIAAPAALKLDTLAAAPVQAAGTATDVAFDPSIPLRDGIALNRQGFYVEASRELNDALSRIPASTPASIQIELLLEAGLADSNIRFTEAAADHFARAEALLASNPGDRTAFLERKRSTYRAFDSLNRRDWNSALGILALTPRAEFPLEDLTILADLNQSDQQDTASAVVGPSAAQLSQIVLDAQRAWASSIAQLSKGGPGSIEAGQVALDRAAADVSALLKIRIDPTSIIWLEAQIERQSGRLALRGAESATGALRDQRYREAAQRFDCALDTLQGRRPASEQACAVPLLPASRNRVVAAAARVGGPIIAETQIERASVLARTGAPQDVVLADYDAGIDALLVSGRAGSSPPSGMEAYLDLLVKTAPSGTTVAAERFFKAIQAVGEPAIARQMSQLQSVVTAGGDVAARVRERAQLVRDIAGLRYQIEDAATDPAKRDALVKDRNDKAQRQAQIDDELASNGALRAIDDHPATVAEIQKALFPGEAYFKLAEIRARTYGIVIDKTQATVYRVDADPAVLAGISRIVRRSIRDDTSKIPYFNVASSYALFRLLAGPAQEQLLAAKAIAVDPAGPLAQLPAAVLVTNVDSVKSYIATREKAPNDYSKVAFLAGQADLSVALSPRSFIDARALAPSHAPNPFIGFGQHAPPTVAEPANTMVQVGLGCAIPRSELVAISEANKPISAAKIAVAADALGVPNAPRIVGADFTDLAIESRADLGTYQVLHFATHGLPETKFGCGSIPPSLVTTIGGPGSDGFLSFGEVAGLKLDANLVVLSACDTSASASGATGRRSGQEESGRALDGLVRAFLAANARAVLATYWQVSVEQESDELFRTFYSRGRTESIGDALKDAQRDLMSQARYSHPYFWGAYFIVGDTSKTMLTKPAVVASR